MSLFLPARGDDFQGSSAPLPLTGDVARLVAFVDEHSLVARVRGGDQEAFGAIFQAYAASLYGYVERLVRSRAVAQEVVHDTFVALWVNRSAWVVQGTVAAYLH